jgi:hypothetical protein
MLLILSGDRSLKKLDLGGDDGALAIAEALALHPSLSVLPH